MSCFCVLQGIEVYYREVHHHYATANKFYGRRPSKILISFSIAAPSLRCLPERVNGIPICLEIRDFAAEIPRNLFQEKPPLFINTSKFSLSNRLAYVMFKPDQTK